MGIHLTSVRFSRRVSAAISNVLLVPHPPPEHVLALWKWASGLNSSGKFQQRQGLRKKQCPEDLKSWFMRAQRLLFDENVDGERDEGEAPTIDSSRICNFEREHSGEMATALQDCLHLVLDDDDDAYVEVAKEACLALRIQLWASQALQALLN